MANYYKTNGIYRYLRENGCTDFSFVSGNMWWLVYADRQSEPKLLVMACAVSDDAYAGDAISYEEIRAERVLGRLSELTELPLLVVRFSGECEEVARVKISRDRDGFAEINLSELKEVFRSYGLEVSRQGAATHKYLNSAKSSAYHAWQRAELGYLITVTDLDLIRTQGDKPVAIYELKRSFYPLDGWRPYRDDYANFEIISKLAKRAGTEFEIVYNRYLKDSNWDDVSQLMRFRYDHTTAEKVKKLGRIGISDFVG